MFFSRPNAAVRARVDQMRGYLSGYPIYTPPHMANVRDLTKEQALENFEYFLEHQTVRLDALAMFLSKYGATLGVDEAGLISVSSWFFEQGGLLLAYVPYAKAHGTFLCLDRRWDGDLTPFNAVFDLGIFVAACLMHRNPKLEWHLAHGGALGERATDTRFYLRGFKIKGKWIDPLQQTFLHCLNAARGLELNKPPHSANFLKLWLEDRAAR